MNTAFPSTRKDIRTKTSRCSSFFVIPPSTSPSADQLVIFLMALLYIYGNNKCTSKKSNFKKINGLLFSFLPLLVSMRFKILPLGVKTKHPLLLLTPTSLDLSRAVFCLFYPFSPLILCLLQQKGLRWGNCCGTLGFYSSVIQPS